MVVEYFSISYVHSIKLNGFDNVVIVMVKDIYRTIRLTLITFLGVFVLGTTSVWAADQDMFDIYSLEVEGHIDGFVTGQFNDDNLTDLVVIYSPHSNRYTRYLGLYLQKATAGFRPRADYLITLPNSTAHLDVGDIDGDNFDEIVLIDFEGISIIKYSATSGLSEPRRLVTVRTIYTTSYVQGIFVEPFIYELTAQPGNELIVPTPGGYSIFNYTNNTLKRTGRLTVPLAEHMTTVNTNDFSTQTKMQLQLVIPELKIIDGNLDGLEDIYFLWNNRVCCFYQNSENGFNQTPDFVRLNISGNYSGYTKSYLADCNNDKRPDLISISTSGGISNTETKLRLYLADQQGIIPENFTDEISLSDAYSNLLVNDYNFDNIPEIVIPAVEMGTFAATKIFLTKKTDMHLLIYNMNADHISNEPDKRLRYRFRFDFTDINPVSEVSFNWLGNYNSDRLRDAVYCDGEERLLFYWGHPTNYLSKNPDLEIPLDHPSQVFPVNLNGNKFSDLIVEHNLRGRYDRLSLLINKGNY